jgi:hypothetical protein
MAPKTPLNINEIYTILLEFWKEKRNSFLLLSDKKKEDFGREMMWSLFEKYRPIKDRGTQESDGKFEFLSHSARKLNKIYDNHGLLPKRLDKLLFLYANTASGLYIMEKCNLLKIKSQAIRYKKYLKINKMVVKELINHF